MLKRILLFIDRYHWLWLLFLSPFLIFPSKERIFLILLFPGIWIVHFINCKAVSRETEPVILPVTPLNGSLLLLMVMVIVSVWVTYNLDLSLEKISGLILGFGLYFSILRLSEGRTGWWYSLLGFLGAGFAWGIGSFFGMDYQIRFSFLTKLIDRIPRPFTNIPGFGEGLQHNAAGGTLLWVIPIFIVLSIYFSRRLLTINQAIKGGIQNQPGLDDKQSEPKNFREKIRNPILKFTLSLTQDSMILVRFLCASLIATLIFLCFVLFISQSRGSYLALGITLILMMALAIPRRWRTFYIFGIISLIGITILVISSNQGWEELILRYNLSDQSGFTIDSIQDRLEIWPRALFAIRHFPITGMGMNTFREVVHKLYPLFHIAPTVDIAHAHNEFLQAALDLGIPGLISFLSIYWICYWMLWRTWHAEHFILSDEIEKTGNIIPLRRIMVLGLGGGLTAHMFFGFADAITLGAKPGAFFWILLGLIAGLFRLVNEETPLKIG